MEESSYDVDILNLRVLLRLVCSKCIIIRWMAIPNMEGWYSS